MGNNERNGNQKSTQKKSTFHHSHKSTFCSNDLLENHIINYLLKNHTMLGRQYKTVLELMKIRKEIGLLKMAADISTQQLHIHVQKKIILVTNKKKKERKS